MLVFGYSELARPVRERERERVFAGAFDATMPKVPSGVQRLEGRQ
jgi:hypothetical protein